ncbi:MAG TPA: 30S ribosomal protein S15 [Candidatus Pacearchaeota archaeon]|nr:30S ribosomal protein S15 [Candidatus Pacearchaeota archaeon]HPR79753.1 30S ribosomal protein S15 [Candidatus Pacearchaeota archaeon]
MLTTEEKTKIVSDNKINETDTGSAEVQVALISEEIQRLLEHLKKHKKDVSSKRGLLKMVAKRRKLLKFLERTSEDSYRELTKKIGLKA